MEATLLVVVLITLFIRWLVLSGKLRAMQQRIEQVAADQTQPMLTRRVYELELAVKELRSMRPAEVPVAPPVSPVVEAKPEPEVVISEPVISQPEAPEVSESLPP